MQTKKKKAKKSYKEIYEEIEVIGKGNFGNIWCWWVGELFRNCDFN